MEESSRQVYLTTPSESAKSRPTDELSTIKFEAVQPLVNYKDPPPPFELAVEEEEDKEVERQSAINSQIQRTSEEVSRNGTARPQA